MIEEIPWQFSVSTAEVAGSIPSWDPCMWEAQPKNIYDIKNEKFLWFQAKPPCGVFPLKIVIFTFVIV